MKRREFLTTIAAASAAATAASALGPSTVSAAKHEFKLKYAPHFGMFKNHAGDGLIDQLRFMADEGFTALEDNNMRERPKEEQTRIGEELARLGMTMGVFVATKDFEKPTFVHNKPEIRERLIADMKDSVEVAKRVNAKWCTVVPGGIDRSLAWDYQTANAIDNLKYCAEVFEPHGLVMVIEPLNHYRNLPHLFLSETPHAYMICRSVGSPACKILYDIYHQQITEGNLLPNIDSSWDEIAYFQIGDNPGRNEPTTGEINYKNIFAHIHRKGFTGVLGMEHGNSQPGKEGERAVINAYKECDNFKT